MNLSRGDDIRQVFLSGPFSWSNTHIFRETKKANSIMKYLLNKDADDEPVQSEEIERGNFFSFNSVLASKRPATDEAGSAAKKPKSKPKPFVF